MTFYQQHRGLAFACPPYQPSPGTTAFVLSLRSIRLSGNGDLDLDTGLDVDDDLLDDLGGGVEAKKKKKRTTALAYLVLRLLLVPEVCRCTYSMRRLWMRIS